MKQSAQKIDPTLSWKQEVNRRVAQHKGRKTAGTSLPPASPDGPHAAAGLAAKAAARVAARYAKAPSYSEMLADEARAAVRAAEVASRAALDAQAVAESVLAGLEAASSPADTWESQLSAGPIPASEWPEAFEPILITPAPAPQSAPMQSFAIRWDDDLPVRETENAPAQPRHGDTLFQPRTASLWDQMHDPRSPLDTQGYEIVEPAQPIHANLIEFPRELVATRKLRPRRAEGPYAASFEAHTQLSIFEVEPWTISTEPQATGAASEAGSAAWLGPEWSGIELDEEPEIESASPALAPATVEQTGLAADTLPVLPAPLNRRLLAAVVDFSLIAGAFLAAAMLAASKVSALPAIREIEAGSVAALSLVGLFYLAVFCTFARATPGMKYANLEICTFSGAIPTRAQRCSRMAALVISLAPLGLGLLWAVFDEDRLCLHDRLSATYPRRK